VRLAVKIPPPYFSFSSAKMTQEREISESGLVLITGLQTTYLPDPIQALISI
jgi:hypothetical protein